MKLENKEINGNFFLKKNRIFSAKEFKQDFLKEGLNVYEVIRVLDNIPLFLEDHCERFANSLKGKGLDYHCDRKELGHMLDELIDRNSLSYGNVKIVFHAGPHNDSYIIMYPVKHVYPTQKDYEKGVSVCIINEDRPDPEFKHWRPHFKQRVKEIKSEKGVYEVILLNQEGAITEGSQTNLFLIRDDQIISAKSEKILPGITRKYVYEICEREGIPVIEIDYGPENLHDYSSAFLSGTSPKILPIRTMDSFVFNPEHPLLRKLMLRYDEIIRKYIGKKQKQ